ncbi:MAG: hypothetical protein ABI550_01265 [Ignavibacteriaceae bacterium]
MIKKLVLILLPFLSFPQTKIIYTAVDYSLNEVRAAICDSSGSNKYDLGFSKTYLPVWFGDNILFNSDTYIWKCDTVGGNLTKMMEGFRVSVSHDETMFAFYNLKGIGIADTSGKIIKQYLVEPWRDVTITWSKNDDQISYYNLEKETCYLFNLENDSLINFGEEIFNPLWHKSNSYILYNQKNKDGLFDVILNSIEKNKRLILNSPGEMALVPIWSNDGTKIAYLVIKDKPKMEVQTDMLESTLMLYDLKTKAHTILTGDAGFTDQAFPQMSFDKNDKNIYYTSISSTGIGTLTKINLKTLSKEIISRNKNIDERFPLVKTFK